MGKTFLNNSQSRGLRNNNPGNLRRTSIQWEGKVPFEQSNDNDFEQFWDIEWGLRAMMMDIKNDINKGLNTVTKLIAQYAPPSENNTAVYINNLVSWTGFGSNQVLTSNEVVVKTMAKAIVRMELGSTYSSKLSNSDYDNAYNLMISGVKYNTTMLNEVVIDVKRKCEHCGKILVGLALFFFTYYSLIVV